MIQSNIFSSSRVFRWETHRLASKHWNNPAKAFRTARSDFLSNLSIILLQAQTAWKLNFLDFAFHFFHKVTFIRVNFSRFSFSSKHLETSFNTCSSAKLSNQFLTMVFDVRGADDFELNLKCFFMCWAAAKNINVSTQQSHERNWRAKQKWKSVRNIPEIPEREAAKREKSQRAERSERIAQRNLWTYLSFASAWKVFVIFLWFEMQMRLSRLRHVVENPSDSCHLVNLIFLWNKSFSWSSVFLLPYHGFKRLITNFLC